MAGSVPSILVRSRRCSRTPPRPHGQINTNEKQEKEKKMSNRAQYTPGPASGAQVRKDGEKWTLVLVRELGHSPERVWQALTDPAHLREWAPFDADGNLATVGTTVKLTTVGTPTPQVSETTVTRADAPKVLEYNWGAYDMRWELEPVGGGTRLSCGPTSIAASSPWVLPGGTFVSMCWIGFSPVSPLDASSAPRP